MRFFVKQPMVWDGVNYAPGDRIEIEDGHPYLAIEGWRRRFLEYDATDGEAKAAPTEGSGAAAAIRQKATKAVKAVTDRVTAETGA